MHGKLGLFGALTLFVLAASPAAALDRTQTLDQILAKCADANQSQNSAPSFSPGPRRKVVINPDWLKLPSAGDIADVYPAAARAAHAGGKATVHCLIGIDGRPHDCAIQDETPAGMGFGQAALQLAPTMLFVPKRVDCMPVDGGAVAIPISFKPS